MEIVNKTRQQVVVATNVGGANLLAPNRSVTRSATPVKGRVLIKVEYSVPGGVQVVSNWLAVKNNAARATIIYEKRGNKIIGIKIAGN